MAKEKAVKLLNWIVYVYILTYILPTGKIGPLPIQKICVCLFMLIGILLLLDRRKIKSIIIESKLEIIVFGHRNHLVSHKLCERILIQCEICKYFYLFR